MMLKNKLILAAFLLLSACGSAITLYRWHSVHMQIVDRQGNMLPETAPKNALQIALQIDLDNHILSQEYSSGLGPHPEKQHLSNDKITSIELFFKGKRTDFPTKDTINFSTKLLASEEISGEKTEITTFVRQFGNYSDIPKGRFFLFFKEKPPIDSAKIFLTLKTAKAGSLKDSSLVLTWE